MYFYQIRKPITSRQSPVATRVHLKKLSGNSETANKKMMNIEQYDGVPDWMRSEHMTGVCLFIWFFYMMFFLPQS